MRALGRALGRLVSANPGSLTLGSILLVLALWSAGTPILDLIELKTYDLRVRSRGDLQPSPAVALAVIDEKSLDAEGRWPWPRSKIAALVDVLARDGAKVIGFDIGFSEPDENSELALVRELGRTVDTLGIRDRRLATFISERERVADNDQALARAIRNSSSPGGAGLLLPHERGRSRVSARAGRDRAAARPDRRLEVSLGRLPAGNRAGGRSVHHRLRAGDEPGERSRRRRPPRATSA